MPQHEVLCSSSLKLKEGPPACLECPLSCQDSYMPTKLTQLCCCHQGMEGDAVSGKPEVENRTVRSEGRKIEQGTQASHGVVFVSAVGLSDGLVTSWPP